MADGWGKYWFVNEMGEEKEENQGNFKSLTDINCLMLRDNIGLLFEAKVHQRASYCERRGLDCLCWREAILIDVLSGHLQFVSLYSGWVKKTSDCACLCFCGSDGCNIRMTWVSYKQNESIVCSTNVDHLKTTVKPCYNNIGICDTSAITSDILLQQLIARCWQ